MMPTNFDLKTESKRDAPLLRFPSLEEIEERGNPITAMDQLMASMGLENTFVSAFRAGRPVNDPDAEAAAENEVRPNDYDVLDDLTPEEMFYASRFADVQSPAELARLRRNIEWENRARAIREMGPLPALLSDMVAIITDPTTFIPVVGQLGKGTRVGGRLALGAAGGAVEVGVSELALQSSQETRTVTESLGAVIMGGAFGLGVAGVAGRIASRTGRSLDQVRDAYNRGVDDFNTIAESTTAKSGGAAATPTITAEQTQLAGGRVVRALLRAGGKLRRVGLAAPSLELSTSIFAGVRSLTVRLIDTGLVFEGQVRGQSFGTPLDILIRRHQGVAGAARSALNGLYKTQRRRGGRLSRRKFNEEVGRALRRGDAHDVPEIQQAAEMLRKNVFDPYKVRAIEQRLLAEGVDVKTARSYFTRVYDIDAMKRNPRGFKNIVVDWLRKNVDESSLAAPEELDEIAIDIFNKILGSPSGRIPYQLRTGARGPLRERTFDIPDLDIEEFLVSDAEEVLARYIRTMGADVEFNRVFGRLDMDDDIAKITREAEEMIDAAPTEREKIKIRNEKDRQVRVLRVLAERIRGVSATPEDAAFYGLKRVGRVARNFNFVRLLGSVVISSIPDIGLMIMQEGLTRTFGLLAVDMARGFKGVRLGIKEAQQAGTALEILLSQRISAILDLGERSLDETRIERVAARMGKGFSTIALINHWNTGLKGITSMLVSSRILETVAKLERGKKLTRREIRKLAQGGIDQTMAARIAKQSRHWEKNGPVILGNTDAWDDIQAVEAFRNALLRDVDNTIITPGAGDAPLWTSTEWGKTIFQFKKFAAASTQRVLAAGLQNRDAAALNGFMAIVGLGVLGTALRDFSARGELKERTPLQWINDGLDRSGAASLFYELDALAEKSPLGRSLAKTLTGQETSRFASRGLAGQVLGPTFGLAEELTATVRGTFEGEYTQSDLRRAFRMLPGQNLFYLRFLLGEVQKGAARKLDLPKRQPRKRKRRGIDPTDF